MSKTIVDNTEEALANEVVTNRVAISKDTNALKVSIKAPEFALGNNFLTLCIILGLCAEIALLFLMVKSNVGLAILIPGCSLLAAGLGVAFVKLWLWHNFGEELINIKGNSFEIHRNYGLFKSNITHLILNCESELFTNRNDKWSWREFRGKGIFRLATVDSRLADFGLNLGDQEFEMILRPIAERLDMFKMQPEGAQITTAVEETQEPEIAPSPIVVDGYRDRIEENAGEGEEEKEETGEEVLQPPSLDQQTDGQHKDALNSYLEKARTGKVSKESDKSKEEKSNKEKTK
ncbi:MAG: hypothetical protein JKX74_02920 [Flavobacteriales bacterium]|nr:hypothetical protein [Flavobacteriales bacterium]